MAIKVKESVSSDIFEWNVDTEVQLFHAMRDHKPVGVNRHFQMACIHEKFSNSLNKEIRSQEIWNHLDTMYDLAALNESEILPFPNSESEFHLPNNEFGEMIKTRNGGIELPVKQETKVIKSETQEVRSRSGKEMSSKMRMENANVPRTPKPESEPSPKVPSSGGKTFNFSGTPKGTKSESISATSLSRGGKDSSSKKNEQATGTPKSSVKGTSGGTTPKVSKLENSSSTHGGMRTPKDSKGNRSESSSSSRSSKEGSSVSKSSKDSKEGKESSGTKSTKETSRGGKESSSNIKHSKEIQKGTKDSTGSSVKNKDSGKMGKDHSSSLKNLKGGLKESGNSAKHSKDGQKVGKDSSTLKHLKDGHKGGKETPSKTSKGDSDDTPNSSKSKKSEKEDANLRKRKRLSRQDATSKSNSPVNTPASKRRRT